MESTLDRALHEDKSRQIQLRGVIVEMHLLSAQEMLAVRKAAACGKTDAMERALRANAELLARALSDAKRRRIFDGGAEILAVLSAEEITALTMEYATWNRALVDQPKRTGKTDECARNAAFDEGRYQQLAEGARE